MSPVPPALDPRQLALPPDAKAMLHIFMTDLVCVVPERDKLWVLAPNTDDEAKHIPTLFFCGAQVTAGAPDNHDLYQEEPVWVLDKEDLTIEGGVGELRILNDPNRLGEIPDGGKENGLEWFPHTDSLKKGRHPVSIKPLGLAGDAQVGDLVAGRLQIEQGLVRACDYTMKDSLIRRIQFGALVPARHRGVSTVAHANTEARVYATSLLAAIPLRETQVTFCRKSFGSNGPPKKITLEPRRSLPLIEVVFANYSPGIPLASDTRTEEHEGAKHFGYHYPLLEGWAEPKYVPHRNVYESRLDKLQAPVEPVSLGTLEALVERLKLYRSHAGISSTISDMTVAGYVKNCIPLVSDPPDGG